MLLNDFVTCHLGVVQVGAATASMGMHYRCCARGYGMESDGFDWHDVDINDVDNSWE
jgi:hypothetical protein